MKLALPFFLPRSCSTGSNGDPPGTILAMVSAIPGDDTWSWNLRRARSCGTGAAYRVHELSELSRGSGTIAFRDDVHFGHRRLDRSTKETKLSVDHVVARQKGGGGRSSARMFGNPEMSGRWTIPVQLMMGGEVITVRVARLQHP
ncbi:MAG: hypothetical protein ABI411_00835 [Tahibacter sp.]